MSAARDLVARHALPLIVLVGAAIRFGTLGTQGFWLDEQVTLDVIRQGPIDLLKQVQAGESNPGLYYLLAGGWESVFGSSEIGIRSLTALLGTATIPVVYAAASALGSRRAGLIAAALTATSPVLIWYALEVRNYTLFVFLAAVAFLCFVKALDDRGQRWLWGWALASGLALGTHYFAFFLILPELAWLWLRRRDSRVDTGLAAGAIGVVAVALLPLVATQRGRGDWIEDYSLADRIFQVPEHFLVGLQAPWEALPAAVAVVVGLIALYGVVRAGAAARLEIAIPVSVFFAGLALALVAVLTGDDFLLSRNVLALWVPFATGLALILGAAATGRLGTATAVGLCCLGVGLAIWTAVTPEAQRPDYAELAAELPPATEPRLIVSQTSFSSPLIEYLDGTRFASAEEELATSELVVIEPRRTESYAVGTCWWMHTCGGVDLSPPPEFEVPAGFRLRDSGSTRLFDYRVYSAAEPIEIESPVSYFTPRVFVQAPAS
jgi:hypothetical protein